MGQRHGKVSWASSSGLRNINQNQTSPIRTSRSAVSSEAPDNNLNQEQIETPTVSPNSSFHPSTVANDTRVVDGTAITFDNNNGAASNSLASLSTSPNQIIIRIQLTKMESNNNNSSSSNNNNNNDVNNIFGQPNSTMAPRNCETAGIFSNVDNNLNITCGTHSIINLTINSNIVCDSTPLMSRPPQSNNFNMINSTDRQHSVNANSNNIHCLNIVERPQYMSLPENELNTSENSTDRYLANNDDLIATNNRLNMQNINSSGAGCPLLSTLPNNSTNMTAKGICCMNDLSSKDVACKFSEQFCSSSRPSLCGCDPSQTDHQHHCHTKKISCAYPSKFRCCCESANATNTISSSSSGSSESVPQASNYRNNFSTPNSNCRNGAVVSSNAEQPPVGTPPSPVPNVFVFVDQNGWQPHQRTLVRHFHVLCSPATTVAGSSSVTGVVGGTAIGPMVHSQTDYSHCLVPDLEKIINCSYYWGKMDRYEAERLLEGKPEGTFLLRDSAQEEYLFSVTFRKYGRSLHARIEQLGHKFSFDCHDPGVYTASTVTGLLEHYKDPSCVMFFEPMLTIPLHRNFSFSLQQLCRATIVSHIKYDGIKELQLPGSLKAYLKEYHYKYKVRETPLDESLYPCS